MPRCSMFHVACVLLVLVSHSPSAVDAADRFWLTSAGGSFGTPGVASPNWSDVGGGVGNFTAPTTTDIANFTLNNTYEVTFSTAVTNTDLDVENGIVTFDLNGNSYTGTSVFAIEIGKVAAQTGRLTVIDGTVGVDTAGDDVQVGSIANATGFLTVSTGGQFGVVGLRPDVTIGHSGTGTLSVLNDGELFTNSFFVGNSAGSSGTATITGPQASLNASSTITVGSSGTGSLTVSAGANLVGSAIATTIGSSAGIAGTVTVTGAGSRWTQTGGMIVGASGVGTFNVQSGGAAATGFANFASAAGSFGTASVSGTGSEWASSGNLTVGNGGEGVLNITTGGHVSSTADAILGNAAGAQGSVVVSGTDARLDLAGGMTIGNAGTGSLTISNGGQVTSAGSTIASASTGVGEVTITGAGSSWNVSNLTVALAGAGTMTVKDGANVSVASTLTVSDPASSPVGTLNFQGGTISANTFARASGAVFNWTDGTLSIVGGAFGNAGAALTINGADADDRPTLRLTTGSTTLVAQMGALTVGNNRGAALEVTGGSQLQVPSISIGAADGGDGIVTVSGNNSYIVTTTGQINVGGTASAGGGTGTLNIETGASAFTAATGQLLLWDGGTVNVNGGSLFFGSLGIGGGKINFNSGNIEQYDVLSADDLRLTAILGPMHELGAGRNLLAGDTAMVSANLDINGGRLYGNILNIASVGGASTIFRVRGGGVVQFNNGATLGADTRTFVDDGTINAGTAITQQGELYLSSTSRLSGQSIQNTGLISGSGRIDADLDNQLLGQVRITAGQRLVLGGSPNSNDGLIDVNGGEVEFAFGALTNSSSSPSTGLIAARNATLRFSSGLTNNGAMTFTSGVSEVFGDITNTNALTTPGRIVVSGGAQANFYDDVTNSGSIQVSAAGSLASTALFLGSFTGNGVTGGGHVFLEGDVRPGFSPGTMAFGGDVSFGPLATLEIELAGTNPGTQYDRVTVADVLDLGGALDVTLLGGFTPNAGDSFGIVSAAGGIAGAFSAELLPALYGGLYFDVVYAPTTVSLLAAGVLGDYNYSGVVDAADFTVWRNALGRTGAGLAADGNGDKVITQLDYDVWRMHFGATAGSGSAGSSPTVVPEPATVLLALVGMFAGWIVPGSRSTRRASASCRS